ncbi:MAG: PilN domain-containing protein, partial [Myxococcota bacterium]
RPGENEGSARVLRLGGVAAGATTFAEANLAGFLDSLEASPGFRNIQLVRSASLNRQEGPGLRFGFTCEIAEAPPSGGTGENP